MGKQPRNLSIFGHKLEDFQILTKDIDTVLINQLESFELTLRNPKKLIRGYDNQEEIIGDNFLAFICMSHPELAQLTFEKFGEKMEQSRVMEFEKWEKARREQSE